MTDAQRQRIGAIGIAVGVFLFFVGVFAAHFTGLPATDTVGRDLYPAIPRCLWFESNPCWMVPTLAHLTAFAGSQIAIGAIVFAWIWKRPLTWALATVAAFLFTLEMLILLGIVPNQWLALAQGTLDWNNQRVFITIPKWLVLNNNVAITFGVLKDLVTAGYSTTVLVIVAVGAYQLQERGKKSAQPKPVVVSSYGRPLVKGDR